MSRIQLLLVLKKGIYTESNSLMKILKSQGIRVAQNPMCKDDPIVGLHKSVFDFEQNWTIKPKI